MASLQMTPIVHWRRKIQGCLPQMMSTYVARSQSRSADGRETYQAEILHIKNIPGRRLKVKQHMDDKQHTKIENISPL